MLKALTLGLATLLTLSCAAPTTGTAVTSALPTNTAGRVHITFDPCKAVPATVIQQQQLDSRPPEPSTISDGDVENAQCKYRSQSGYYLYIAASNYTIEMDKKVDHWGFQEFDINGRHAISYYVSAQPSTNSCAVDVAASTGVYGVMVGGGINGYAPYPDCMTAARTNMEAFLPYFPN